MKLNREEIEFIGRFLRNKADDVPGELLEKIEFGLWVPLSAFPLRGLETLKTSERMGLLSGSFEPQLNMQILVAFRENIFPYLLIRVEESWQCYIQCSGQILEATCDEDKDATVTCCMDLRSKCEAISTTLD